MSVLEKKKKVVNKRGMTAVSIMHFFFVTFSQNSHWSHNFLCQKGRRLSKQ